MFVIVVLCRVKPDKIEAFKEAALDEPGCLRFDVVQENEDPTKFWLYEVYQDRAAFDHHLTTPHLHRWREVTKDLFAEPAQGSIGQSIFLSEEAKQ